MSGRGGGLETGTTTGIDMERTLAKAAQCADKLPPQAIRFIRLLCGAQRSITGDEACLSAHYAANQQRETKAKVPRTLDALPFSIKKRALSVRCIWVVSWT